MTPPAASSTPLALLHAYRNLYKSSLRAVQYSIPARYDVRDTLRRTFRETPSSHYSPVRIENTIQFLNRATESKGLEHKIVKNLCLIHYWQYAQRRKRLLTLHEHRLIELSMNSYMENLGLLNESMGLDLR